MPLFKKMKHSFIFLIALTSVTACLNPKQKDEVEDNVMRHHNTDQTASFYIGTEISGEGFDNRPIEGWNVPSSKHYSFRACLSDRITNNRVIGHEFEIVTDMQNKRSILRETDDEGCLIWQEQLPFNYFAEQSQYISLQRQIRGKGIHSGTRTFTVAVNPWRSSRNDRSAEVVDLSKKSLPETQTVPANRAQQFLTQQFEQATQVEVKDLSVRIDSRQAIAEGNDIEIQVSLTPQVVLKNLLGEKVIMNLREGNFDIYAQIVASSTREDKTLIHPITAPLMASTESKSGANEIRFNDDKIDIVYNTPITNYITNGHYDLTLRIIPNNMEGLAGYYAAYRYGDHTQLLGSRGGMRPRISSVETPLEMAEFDDKLQKADEDNLLTSNDIQQLTPFQYGHMDIRFMRVLPDETTIDRTIAFRNEVCVRRTIDGRSAQNEDFVIIRDDGSTYEVNSQNEGCFSWVDTVTHMYYQPERLFNKKVTILHPSSGYREELSSYINPWDYGWTFGQDERKLSSEYIEEVNNREAISSQLFLPGYGYETIRFRYEIDEFLNLEVKKSILLHIDPKVLRYNSITRGRNAIESLRDGVYLLKVAVQKDYYDPRTSGLILKEHPEIEGGVMIENAHNQEVEYISAVKKLVRVKYGRIITPIEFTVNDLRLMRVRSNFLVEISPIDERALGITPDVPITNLDPITIQDQINDLTDPERINPRLGEGSRSNIDMNLVDEDRYFTEEPYEINSSSVSSIEREDRALESRAQQQRDIDDLIATNSGLPSRTFVGPIIMLSNSFGSGVRPTDELTEVTCSTIDCDYLKLDESIPEYDNDPQVAKFYGSTQHLANVTVTDLIERQAQIRQEYRNQQLYESLLSRYTEEFFLDYVSMSDRKLKKLSEYARFVHSEMEFEPPNYFTNIAQNACGSDDLEDCLVEAPPSPTTVEDLLEFMNFEGSPPPVHIGAATGYGGYGYYGGGYYSGSLGANNDYQEMTEDDLMDFIVDPEGLDDRRLAQRLCYTWIYYMMGERIGFDPRAPSNNQRQGFWGSFSASTRETYSMAMRQCTTNAQNNLSEVFHISQKLLPNKVNSYRFLGGKSMNFNVGASFSLNYGESLSSSLSADFDPLSLLKLIPKGIGSVLGMFGLKTGWNASQQRSLGEGTSITSGTYLAMQRASMDLYFDEFERCSEIRMNMGFLENNRQIGRLLETIPENKQPQAAAQGLFLCTGKKERSNRPHREMYYYFTQHFTQGDMLDSGDLLNHPWLLALRGERDYAHFVNLIQATPDAAKESQDFDIRWLPNNVMHRYLNRGDEVNDINRSVDLGERPIDQLVDAYRTVPPTFPGIYTVRPPRLDYPITD